MVGPLLLLSMSLPSRLLYKSDLFTPGFTGQIGTTRREHVGKNLWFHELTIRHIVLHDVVQVLVRLITFPEEMYFLW